MTVREDHDTLGSEPFAIAAGDFIINGAPDIAVCHKGGNVGIFAGDHGTTLLLVTHDDVLAERADRVVSLRDGRVAGERRRAALVP